MHPNGDQQHQQHQQHPSTVGGDTSAAGTTIGERKRAAAAFVDAAMGNGDGSSRASPSVEDGAGVQSGADTGSPTTFQVWSRDSHTFCTECEDTRATVLCQGCDEAYCSLCWAALHRRGERAKHGTTPLGSEKDLAPPPEALEESGWLAGVWPSQRPRPNQSDSPASPAETRGPAESQTHEGRTVGGPGVSISAGGDNESAVPSLAAATAAGGVGGRQGGNGVASGDIGDVGDVGAGKEEYHGGGGGGGAGTAERARGWETSGPVGASNGSAAARDVGDKKQAEVAAEGAGAGAGMGNGRHAEITSVPAAAAAAAAVEEEARLKRSKLNGSASASRPGTPPSKNATGTTEVVEASPSAHINPGEETAPENDGNAGCNGDGGVRGRGGTGGRRPEGHEGPLCPSGNFFSKPQTPPPSPKAAKRPRSPPLTAEKTAAPGAPCPNGNGTAVKGVTEEGKVEIGLVGVGLDKNREADVAGGGRGTAHGRGSQESDRGSGSGNGAAAGGGVREANGHAASPSATENKNKGIEGSGGGNGCAGSAAAETAGGEAAGGADEMDVEAPLFSSEAIAAAAAAAKARAGAGVGAGAGAMDVELPLVGLVASSSEKGGSRGGVVGGASAGSGGDAAGVGPAREATEEEKRGLADLKRRSTNIPLRLDPREREILGVLEGSLHHMQYTDAVDRILRGNRLPHVLKNLKHFFTSVWGMYKASGVASPTYSPPNSGAAGAKAKRPLMPPHYKTGDGRAGSSPLMLPRSAFGKARASAAAGGGSSNGASNGGGGGVGGKVGAGGGVGYREDSFDYKRTGWNYTLDWACVLRTCCEVGRRHKILNPEKMRSAHGMLMCILMDTEHPQVREQTGFSCVRKMRTAFGLSASTGLLGLFEDPDLLLASRPVLPWERDQKLQKSGRNSEELVVQAKEKAEARRRLLARHGAGGLACEVKLLVDSVADSIVYREISTRPIRRMLSLLKHHWRPDRTDDARKNANLGISYGEYGARLTHNHRTQFYFVMQSLMLWLEVLDHMLDLWAAGERDMLDEHNQYRLSNTGQGLQRVQGASRVGKRMHEYQARVNAESGRSWVGSAVVHLGDSCVPNALTFLDKYSQVPWILNPILQALDYLSDLEKGSDPAVLVYVKERWGSVEYAQRYILRNFFRFGFDGSGGDNNYDAGSCVDGRLTSAWNWCSKIEKKSFLYIFLLSGFSGFDGDFSR